MEIDAKNTPIANLEKNLRKTDKEAEFGVL
jgi:hypothetical protein